MATPKVPASTIPDADPDPEGPIETQRKEFIRCDRAINLTVCDLVLGGNAVGLVDVERPYLAGSGVGSSEVGWSGVT